MLFQVTELTGLEKFFIVCAVAGGLLLIIRIIFQFLGIGSHSDVDTSVLDGSAAHGIDAHHGGSDISFKLLSMQGLTAFFLMFGLVGLALLRQSKVSAGLAMAGATLAGLATVWIMAQIFSAMKRLQSSGNIDLRQAIGQVGVVYLNIPEAAAGQVQIAVQGRLRIYDAISKDKKPIKTGCRVRVLDVISENILVVELVTE